MKDSRCPEWPDCADDEGLCYGCAQWNEAARSEEGVDSRAADALQKALRLIQQAEDDLWGVMSLKNCACRYFCAGRHAKYGVRIRRQRTFMDDRKASTSSEGG